MSITLANSTASITAAEVQTELGSVDRIDRIAEEWRELCEHAADDQPFYRPEWIAAYLRAVAPKAQILLVTVRTNGLLRMVLPLVHERGTFCKVPVRKLSAPVNHIAGRFDATCSALVQEEAAIKATWDVLKADGSWDVLSLRYSLDGNTVSRLVSVARADGFSSIRREDNPSPYLSIPTEPDLRKALPSNIRLRRQLRQIRREIAKEGSSLKLHRIEAADPTALNRFFDLESSGWKGQQRSSILFSGDRPFFEEIARAAARFHYFTLYMLELNGQLIAAHYGFTHRSWYYSVVVAYDEAFKHFSPGHLIIDEIVNDCAARGVRVYDTTGQNQEWKMKWTTQVRPMNHFFVFKGPMGEIAHTVATQIRPRIDRLLKRTAV